MCRSLDANLFRGILCVNFRMKWLLCTRLSTVQALTKSVSGSWSTGVGRHFNSKFPYKVALVRVQQHISPT